VFHTTLHMRMAYRSAYCVVAAAVLWDVLVFAVRHVNSSKRSAWVDYEGW